MGNKPVCECVNPEDFTWRKSPCDECGWHCLSCNRLAAGETPGYRPDLDVTHLDDKVESILEELHAGDFVYVSNSSQGDSLVGGAVAMCEASGCYDQSSIIRFLMAGMGDGEYWKESGDAIRAGKGATR